MSPQVYQPPERAIDGGDKSGFGSDGSQSRYRDRAFGPAARPVLIAACRDCVRATTVSSSSIPASVRQSANRGTMPYL